MNNSGAISNIFGFHTARLVYGTTYTFYFNIRQSADAEVNLSDVNEIQWRVKQSSLINNISVLTKSLGNGIRVLSNNTIEVTFNTAELDNIDGKYVHQLELIESGVETYIIKQGYLIIENCYNTDKIHFIGNTEESLIFEFFEEDGKTPLDILTYTNITWELKEYGEVNDEYLLKLEYGNGVTRIGTNKVEIALKDAQTRELWGKYAQKITGINSDKIIVLSQGFIIISRDIKDA